MAVLRAYQNKEWVKFGACECTGTCECSEFLVHRLGPAEMRTLTQQHSYKKKERWPDGWREEITLKDSFNDEYCRLVILDWRKVFGADGKLLPFTPENLLTIREITGLRFQEFLNELLKGSQMLHAEIEKAEVKNSLPG